MASTNSNISAEDPDKVDFEHPDYVDAKQDWYKVRTMCKGSRAVKSQGDKFLPRPCPGDTSEDNRERYKAYKKRAVFTNFTGRTLSGLKGEVMKKAPEIELPPILKIFEDDVDGQGTPLIQHASITLEEALSQGRGGLLTDYPKTEGVTTKAQQDAGLIRPTIVHYRAEDIINWWPGRVGAETIIKMVVLKEGGTKKTGNYSVEKTTQYRVLSISAIEAQEDGDEAQPEAYTVAVYQIEDGEVVEVEAPYQPRGKNGQTLSRIPFHPVGAKKNDMSVDTPPLLDIAEINGAHYINSADNEEMSHISGQGTLWTSGLTAEWVKDEMGGEIRIGSRGHIPLPEGGQAGLIQVAPNTMPGEGMKAKREDMVSMGAKLVSDRSSGETATRARMDDSSETSVLTTIANNVSDAYRAAIESVNLFVDFDGEFAFALNTDFDIHTLGAQDQMAIIAAWQGGIIDFEEARDLYKRAGLAHKDDEEVRNNVEEEQTPPLGDDTKDTEDDE